MEHGNLFERLRDTVRDFFLQEARAEAPTLLPASSDPPNARTLEITVGAVALPRLVAEQLRRLGVPLAAYSHGELQDAVEGCAVDCNLLDDDEGVNFTDRLRLTPFEREARITRTEPCAVSEVGPHASYVRAERVRSFAQGLGGTPALSF